jgi:hypothetical protein
MASPRQLAGRRQDVTGEGSQAGSSSHDQDKKDDDSVVTGSIAVGPTEVDLANVEVDPMYEQLYDARRGIVALLIAGGILDGRWIMFA